MFVCKNPYVCKSIYVCPSMYVRMYLYVLLYLSRSVYLSMCLALCVALVLPISVYLSVVSVWAGVFLHVGINVLLLQRLDDQRDDVHMGTAESEYPSFRVLYLDKRAVSCIHSSLHVCPSRLEHGRPLRRDSRRTHLLLLRRHLSSLAHK